MEQEEQEEQEGGEGRELLRARYLAQCSPRVFWSLVHFASGSSSGDSSSGSGGNSVSVSSGVVSIPLALMQLLPGVDWSWLVGEDGQEAGGEAGGEGGRSRRRLGLGGGRDGDSVRRRVLSDKALQSQRQQREAAREAQERKDRKRLLAEARERKRGGGVTTATATTAVTDSTVHDSTVTDSAVLDSVSEDAEGVSEQRKPATTTAAAAVDYQGPVQSAEDMLRTLLLTGYHEQHEQVEQAKSFIPRYRLLTEALRSVFQLDAEEGSSSGSGSGSGSDSGSGSGGRELLCSQLLHALADTALPPAPSCVEEEEGEEEEEEEGMSSSMALLHAVETQLYLQTQSHTQAATIPFLTLCHLRYWIQMARWMLSTHFWSEELLKAAAAGGAAGGAVDRVWAEVLWSAGVQRVRDLALWRHAPADLAIYLSSSSSSSDSNGSSGGEYTPPLPSEEALRSMCLVAESFREQCSWVDEWAPQALPLSLCPPSASNAGAGAGGGGDGSGVTVGCLAWYRDSPPSLCTDMSPEGALCALHATGGGEAGHCTGGRGGGGGGGGVADLGRSVQVRGADGAETRSSCAPCAAGAGAGADCDCSVSGAPGALPPD